MVNDDLGNYRGFRPGQHLAIFIKDESNNRKQYISNNNGYLVRIREVFFKSIKVDFFKSVDRFDSETTIISDYPKSGSTTYLSVRFKIWDRVIGHRLNYFDDDEDTSSVPEPIETFIGFNSQMEGGIRSILQLYLKEDIDFSINTLLDSTNEISFETVLDGNDRYGLIKLGLMRKL